MAESIELGKAKTFTLRTALDELTKVTLPAGTKFLKYSADAPFFIEPGLPDSTADGAAVTPGDQFKYQAGMGSDKLEGMGTHHNTSLTAERSYYFYGSEADQEISMWAVREHD